jgi:hypothetical protein
MEQVEGSESNFKINNVDLPGLRRQQWKSAIEQELQDLVTKAALIRDEINGAKTEYKKQYFHKKFTKIQQQVMQMVAALQRIQAQENATSTPPPPMEDHVHDENCQHKSEEARESESI